MRLLNSGGDDAGQDVHEPKLVVPEAIDRVFAHAAERAVNASVGEANRNADVRADRWMLYHHLSTFAGDGMTHSECRVHTADGALVASFSVDAMVRAFGGHVGRRDERTAL